MPIRTVGGPLLVNGTAVLRRSNSPVGPFIESADDEHLYVNVHDWVGALRFSNDSGEQTVHVFPAKLAEEAQAAFEALARLVDDLPELTGHLGYPTDLVNSASDLRTQTLQLHDLVAAARQAWQLTRRWQRTPRLSGGSVRRVVRGGAVPDRIDWELTLDHWGQGGLPDHVARDLRDAKAPGGGAALRTLWETLADAAATVTGGSSLAIRSGALAMSLPLEKEASRTDPVSRDAEELARRVQALRRRSVHLPAGHARMPDLYELWSQASMLRALGATDGQFVRDGSGRYTGTFQGPGVTVTVSPRLGFRGVGRAHEQLMPDLLAVFDTGVALVFDVKYRAVDRFSAEQQRAVNAQLLGYMGLTQAAVGIVLWPAPLDEPFFEGVLPGGRARLLRLRCHPFDPPGALKRRLYDLNLPGVT